MQETRNNETENATLETASPTANWAKPKFKRKLALKPRLKLVDSFGNRRILPPNEQPKTIRYSPNKDELAQAIAEVRATASATRRDLARIFNAG